MTCVLTWRLGRSIAGRQVGLLAALVLATTPIMVAESKLATTDATLACLFVAAQGCLWGLSRRESKPMAVGFWVILALMTLLKGPVGPVFVAASGLVSWWWGGPTTCWRRLRWRAGLVGFVLLTAPWYLWEGLASRGEFFRFAWQTQIVQRISSGMEQHGGFPGYYLVLALPVFFPWSAFLGPAIVVGWSRRRTSPEFGFLLGWVVGPWLILECFGTKLIHYYLPCFPAWALLIAGLLFEVSRGGGSIREFRLGLLSLRSLGFFGYGTSLVLAGATLIVIPGPLVAPSLVIAGVLGIGTLFARIGFERHRPVAASGRLIATWAVIMLIVGCWLLPAAEPFRFSRRVGERLAELSLSTKVRPAMMTFQEPGLIYALGHPACDVRGYDEMADEVGRSGPIVLPLLPSEVNELRLDPRFQIQVIEPISGFNTNKGKVQELEFVIVEAPASALTRSVEKSLVK